MKKRILALTGVLVLVAVLIVPMGVLADNEATQGASTTKATTILIRDQLDAADVTTITFPAGAPDATIANPSNSAAQSQVLTAVAADATPIALLTSDTAYKIWYTITDLGTWDDAVAMEELHTIAVDAELTLAAFQAAGKEITVWDTPTDSLQSIAVGTPLEFYLTVQLEAATGKTGTSTLTILGETP